MEQVRLGDVCDILNGFAFKSSEYQKSGIRILRITNVQNGYIEDNEPKYYSIEQQSKIQKYLLKENDLLISLTGNVGRVGLLKRKMLPAALNQRVACLRVKKGKDVSINYIFNILNTKYFEKQCEINSKGIAQKNLSTEWLKKYLINIPNIAEQIEISNKLDKLQKMIDKRKKQIEGLEEFIKSKFIDMFGTPFINEKKWKIGHIKDLINESRYGTSRPAIEGGKYKYLRMNNITYDGNLDLADLKYIDIPEKELDKCTTQNGDILFNRTNSRELVGKTCVYNMDERMVIAGFIIRIRVNKNANPYFISTYLNTKYLKEKLYSMCKNASGQSNINAQELQKIEIYIPPIELQNNFAEIVKQINKHKIELENSLKGIESLQESLINKYFGG